MDKPTDVLFDIISFVSKLSGLIIFVGSAIFMVTHTFICISELITEGGAAFNESVILVFIGLFLLIAIGALLCIFGEMIREHDE